MGEAKCMVGWPAGRPDFSKKRAAARRAGWMDPARPFFLKNLAGRLASQPCIWIHPSILGVANHVFGFPHPFLSYTFGIGIPLDIFSLLWVVSASLEINAKHKMHSARSSNSFNAAALWCMLPYTLSCFSSHAKLKGIQTNQQFGAFCTCFSAVWYIHRAGSDFAFNWH